ncbi:MAG TPA: class I SAM-dependent methyltransferase [Gemmatimonadaceae bacterium]|nr:class I SAM-dependent methyltransferase [Gemmatimonadaceae bacterium]
MTDSVLEHTLVYRLWQAPFAERKFAPIAARNDVSRIRRVLDVGCGPGTNTHHFAHADYVGIDINPRYIDAARRRTGRTFIAADATTYVVDPAERFDFIFLNSFLHHVDTPSARRILSHVATLLTEDGAIHILDLIRPDRPSIALTLAKLDRGDFPRPLAEWRSLFEESYRPVVFEPYPLGAFGVTLWNMVYFKGQRR